MVQVEYPQDWLTTRLEESGQKQASWRTDPAQSGGGAIGDIGTHAHNLAAFVTGLELEQLCADMSTFVEGRRVDDNCNILLRYAGGARGMLWASQVAPGNENNLKIRVYGEQGRAGVAPGAPQPAAGFAARRAAAADHPRRGRRRRGGRHGHAASRRAIPRAIWRAFANIYTGCAELIAARLEGREPDPEAQPGARRRGRRRGVKFIAAAIKSGARGGVWVDARLDLSA